MHNGFLNNFKTYCTPTNILTNKGKENKGLEKKYTNECCLHKLNDDIKMDRWTDRQTDKGRHREPPPQK